jgi:large subunit ribosomal protein L25
MAEITLVAELGRETGSSASRRLRRTGHLPAVIYGHGMEPVAVTVGGRDLRAALSAHGLNQVLTLDVDGVKRLVLARQLQRHPVSHTVAHVDFQVVSRDEIVNAEVPIVIVGNALKVELDRGVVQHNLSTLSIRSTPGQIPEEVQVDISDLEVGGAVRVGDLRLPKGVTTDVDPEETVVSAVSSVVPTSAAGEEAEPSEGPPASGTAGSAGAPAGGEG